MDKAILIIDMPSCCNECRFLNDNYDYPVCLITQEQRGYTFRTREQKMDSCPLRPAPEKIDLSNFDNIIKAESDNAYEVGMCMYNRGIDRGYNICIDNILGN